MGEALSSNRQKWVFFPNLICRYSMPKTFREEPRELGARTCELNAFLPMPLPYRVAFDRSLQRSQPSMSS